MKLKTLTAIFACTLFMQKTYSQNGYIYIHQKTLNEQASVDFSYSITGPSSFSQTFSLNNNPAYIQNGDLGAGHGTTTSGNGDGELWTIASTTVANYNVSPAGLTGGIYRRPSGSSQWVALTATNTTTNVLAIDGAYYNECVFVNSSKNVYFYYSGTATQIYSGGDATDVTANNGNIAIVSGGKIKVYNKQYVAGASINTTNGAWTTLSTGPSTTTATRLDLNLAGSSILSSYVNGTTETVYTTGITVTGGTGTTAGTITQGTTATVTTFTATTDTYGNSVSGAAGNPDVAYDDKGYIFVLAKSPIYNAGDVVFSNTSGSFVYEPQSRAVSRITAASGGQAWGAVGKGTTNSIWTRSGDGTHIWIDDERVRVAGVGTTFNTGGYSTGTNYSTGKGVANGNGIMIPVTPGTYVITETLPDATWDLGRYTTYVPSTSSISTNVGTQQVTITVAANDVVHVEYFNEKLSPKAIALTCTTSVLEDFGTGSNTFGDTTQGTAYHYYPQATPQDGEYFIVQSLSSWFITTHVLQSHTNPGTGYFLVVNASYATDEFFRKRVTNLVPGLSYTISFYAANVNYSGESTPATQDIRIPPNVLYGLQDANGNIVTSQSTGSIDSTGSLNSDGSIKWEPYSFTFTATTSQADLFFRNNTIGGLGNDIALDDISLNPVLTPLGANVISPTVAPNLCVGSRYTFTNSATAANPTAAYRWSSSNTSVATIDSVSGKVKTLAAGNVIITYTLTNTIGCVSTATSTLTAVAPPTATTSDKFGGVLCQGSTDSLFATVTGAVSPSYTWSQSATGGGLNGGTGTASTLNTTATPTVGGTSYTYTFVVKDAITGCSATSSVTVAVSSNIAPTVTANSSKTLVCYGSTTALTATATGTGPYTYTWTGSGTITPNGNAAAASATATPTASGIYTVVVNDGQGCTNFATTATVTSNPQLTASATPSLTNVCQSQPITVTANAAGGNGTYSYAWIGTPNGTSTGGGITSGATTATISAIPSNALSGSSGTITYMVTVTDGNGCVATSGSPTVTVSAFSTSAPTLSNTTVSGTTACNGQTTLTLSTTRSGGTGTGTYTWSGNGTFTSTNPYTNTSTSVTTTIGVKPTANGAYTVQITDANGCSASATTSSVTVKTLPSITASATPPTKLCNNGDIPLTAVASGGSGTYSSYTWATVQQPTLTTITYSPNSSSTANNSVANVAFTVIGVGTSYQFSATVTDNNGCTATSNTPVYTITTASLSTAPTLTAASATYTGNICAGETAITLSSTRSTSGGTAPFTYAWSGPASTYTGAGQTYTNSSTSAITTTATPTTAGSGNYTVTLTDANSCNSVLNTSSVTINGQPTVTANSNYTLLCLSTSNPLTLTLTSTATPAGSATISSYAWTASATGGGLGTTTTQNTTATPTTAGTYTYTMKATDNLGCYASATTGSVLAAATPVVTATATPPANLCAGNNITLAANITTATTAPYVYSWSYPSISVVTPATQTTNSTSISGITAATDTAGTYIYTISVTDANGCSGSANTGTSITIGQVLPSISYTCGNTSGTEWVNFMESNGASWLWTTTSGGRFYTSNALSANSDSSTSHLQAPYVTFNGTYTVSIVTSAGCTGTGSYTITSTSCGIILAVSNLNFTAVKQDNEALLAWSTATELNNNHFDIERSSDGVNWQVIGSIKAKGNSAVTANYSFTDALPLNGINYYRLKQVDNNGQYSYSQVRSLQFTGQWLVKLYPNPVQNFVVLEFNNDRDETGAITIQSVSGAAVFTTEQQLAKGLNRIILNQVQRMAQGTYILTLRTNENIFRSKFVKGGD